MTQPPGQPPHDGYGAQPPQQPPYPGPYQPAPGPGGQAPGQPGQPGQPPNPYSTAPQQPYGGGGQQPYGGGGQQPYGGGGQQPYGGAPGAPGVPDYGQQYGGYPPPPPPPSGGSGGKIALIVVAAVAALAVIGGGVFLFTRDGTDESATKPQQSVSAQATESESPTAEPTEEYSPTPDASDPAGDASTPPGKGVEGQWQDEEARTLTIGEAQASGDLKDQHPLSYIDMVGGKGIMTGVGAYRDDNNFRMALRPMASEDVSDEDLTFATVRRSGDDVVITWEGGGTDTLSYVGEASS